MRSSFRAFLQCAVLSALPFWTAYVLFPHAVHAADTTELYALGAIQNAMGGGGAAYPQDTSWILLNPAGLAVLGGRLDLNLELFTATMSAEPRGNPLVVNPRAGSLESSLLYPLPSFGLSRPWGEGTLGLGVFPIQGDEVDYPRSRTTLSLPWHGDRRVQHHVIRAPLAYAFALTDSWYLGISLVPAITRFRTDSITLRLRPVQSDYDWDYALGVGAGVGVYKRGDRLSLGFAYLSRTEMQDYERYQKDLIRWSLDLPQKFYAGVAIALSPKVDLTLDYKWINWSSINIFGKPTLQGGLNVSDQHSLKAGVAWKQGRWTWRAGISWNNVTIPEESVFINSLSPAVGSVHLAVGFSRRLSPTTSIHAAFVHVLPESQTESGDGDIISRLTKGSKIGYRENTVTLQYSIAF